jgi:hypothetical protein
MKKIAQKLIQRFAPEYVSMVDAMPARVARVFFSALLFASFHTHVLDCDLGGGIPQMIGGLFYGALMEKDEDIVSLINYHIIYNCFDYMITG